MAGRVKVAGKERASTTYNPGVPFALSNGGVLQVRAQEQPLPIPELELYRPHAKLHVESTIFNV